MVVTRVVKRTAYSSDEVGCAIARLYILRTAVKTKGSHAFDMRALFMIKKIITILYLPHSLVVSNVV